MIAASWLTAARFDDVSDVVGGHGAWAQMQIVDAVSAR
jgi:rhodanese-related sulfurtransferase